MTASSDNNLFRISDEEPGADIDVGTTAVQLRRSEARYRALVEASSQVVWVWDPLTGEGSSEASTGWWEGLTGQSREAQKELGWLASIHPDDRPLAGRAWGNAMRDGRMYDIEYRVRAHSGEYRHVLARAVPVRDVSGEVVEWVGTLADVTDRHRAEEALRISEERFATAFRISPDALTISRQSDARIIEVNESWQRITGYSREETLGRTPLELNLHADPEKRPELFALIAEQGFLRNHETEVRRKSGEIIHISLSVEQTVINGEPIFLTIIRDITESRRSQQALRESESRFRQLADAMPQIVWSADTEGRIDYLNRRWYEYAGIEPASLDPEDWELVVHPEDWRRITAAWSRRLREAMPVEEQVRLRDAGSGEYRWHLVRTVPVNDDEGRLIRWYGTATDFHAQKMAEEALREADQRKDEFLATLAHELRNPLAPLATAVELLRLAADDPELIDQAVATMERQVGHMVRLIDDLLEISRITRGKIELRREPVDVRAVASGAVETTRMLLEAAGHTLHIDLPEEPLPVFADPVRLTQMIANLLNNAVRYTPNGGTIHLHLTGEDGKAVIRISDNGIGIPREMLSRIFEMFTQVDRSSARGHGGLGIGLALVRNLALLHDGSVEAESDGDGTGSTFTIRLPLHYPQIETEAIEPSVQREPPTATTVRRVLVVDDNVDAAESLGAVLRVMGHSVQVVHSGSDAIALLDEFRPDAVLLDIGMPDMNGYEVACAIRDGGEYDGLTLVALTGWGQEQDRRRSREAGFDHHLTKPVDMATLASLLASL